MKFWIVTPSYNQADWLKLCVASVRDQVSDEALNAKNVELPYGSSNGNPTSTCNDSNDFNKSEPLSVHHHVQDACSTDGTMEWLAEYISQQPATNNYQLTFASEVDEGMYDAINRGWKLAPDDVDVIAHLNCDEQYLPGALQTIAEFFKAHQKADVVLADMIVVDKDGEYICHRRSLKPNAIMSHICVGGFTATTFQRGLVTKEKGVFFDASWRNVGDKVWYNALHKAGCRFVVCNQLVSVFTETGANLNWTEEGLREKRRYEDEYLFGPVCGRLAGTLVGRVKGAQRYLKEFLIHSPKQYSIFWNDSKSRKTLFICNPTGLWHKKWPRSKCRDG